MIDLQRKLCAEHSKGEERTTSVVRVEACRCRRSGTCRTFGSLIRIYRAGHRVLAAVAGGVRAEGLEPSRGYPQRIFVPSTAFAAPPRAFVGLASLRSGLYLHHAQIRLGLGAARLVSTPFRRGCRRLARDCHYRFPRIWAVLHRRFPGEHSSFDSSPLRLPFRHARMAHITVQRRPRVKEPDGTFKSLVSANSTTPAWKEKSVICGY